MLSAYRHGAFTDGFTLLEILVSIIILSIIMGIVYESFMSVTEATLQAQTAAEEMRLRQFLMHNFQQSFSTVYVDPAYLNEQCQFIGANDGSSDSVEFCSSAPLMGGAALPGMLKRVHYGAVGQSEVGMDLGTFTLDDESGEKPSLFLESSETPITISMTESKGDAKSDPGEASDLVSQAKDAGYESPAWSVPISGLDFAYYDGQDWVEEWDSLASERLPWCVRVRVNFARSRADAESESDYDLEKNADFEAYYPIPMGAGVLSEASVWVSQLMVNMNAETMPMGTGTTTSTSTVSPKPSPQNNKTPSTNSSTGESVSKPPRSSGL